MSIESPVEMLIPGVTQGLVREEAGQTYAEYLHYAAHQRPDVLMVDRVPSAEMFQRLALFSAGSMVITSLPAFDAASALVKLRALTSPAFVAGHVACITAQRLVRAVCEHCREEIVLPPHHRQKLGFGPDDQCYVGQGCDRCQQTGYAGMTAIFEIVRVTDPVKQALMRLDTADDVRALLAEQRIPSLRDNGMRKVKQGLATIQDVLKATML
jgi:type IV pilus assembly protein PilB